VSRMPRLPFDTEPLLRLFMTVENAGSFVGDPEERFHSIQRRNVPVRNRRPMMVLN